MHVLLCRPDAAEGLGVLPKWKEVVSSGVGQPAARLIGGALSYFMKL